MSNNRLLILNSKKIEQKINRLAYQIYEDNFDEKEIVIAGIYPRGSVLVTKLENVLKKISKLKITVATIRVNKEQPGKNDIEIDLDSKDYEKKAIVLVDDVLNSGKTMSYAQAVFLQVPIKKLRTVVLVDRNHKQFPVHTDYSGFSVSTILQEHIDVELEGKEMGVYLR